VDTVYIIKWHRVVPPPPPHLPTSHRIWTNPKTGSWDKWGGERCPRGYATGLIYCCCAVYVTVVMIESIVCKEYCSSCSQKKMCRLSKMMPMIQMVPVRRKQSWTKARFVEM